MVDGRTRTAADTRVRPNQEPIRTSIAGSTASRKADGVTIQPDGMGDTGEKKT